MSCKTCERNVLDLDHTYQEQTRIKCRDCNRTITDIEDHNKSNFRLWLEGKVTTIEYMRAALQGEP